MLDDKRRLKKNKDFQMVFKKGKSLAGKYLVVYWAPNNLENNRYGLSVSKKVGKAVDRNRIKRVLRALIYKFEKIRSGFDIIVIARPKIKGICTSLVEMEFKRLLARTGLM